MSKVKFVTQYEHLTDLYPPIPAGKAMPQWLRDARPKLDVLDEHGFNYLNIKACPGVMDVVSSGYIIPAWADILVNRRVDEYGDSASILSSNGDNTNHFSPEQMIMEPLGAESAYSMKIQLPWMIETDPGYSILMTAPFWHQENRFSVVPGIVDTDVLHQQHVLFTIAQSGRFLIEAGTPLLQIHVFKRESHDLEVVQDENLWTNMYGKGLGGIGLGRRFTQGAYREYRGKHRRENGLV